MQPGETCREHFWQREQPEVGTLLEEEQQQPEWLDQRVRGEQVEMGKERRAGSQVGRASQMRSTHFFKL